MQTDNRCGADPAENQTLSYSPEVELEGNEVNPWPYLCFIMQCKLCLPRETKLAVYKYIDNHPSQACRGKVNIGIIAFDFLFLFIIEYSTFYALFIKTLFLHL